MPELADYIRHSFTEEHISGLVGVVKDLDKLPVSKMSSYADMNNLCAAVDQTVHLLLVSDLLSSAQQVSSIACVFLLYIVHALCLVDICISA